MHHIDQNNFHKYTEATFAICEGRYQQLFGQLGKAIP